MNIVEMRKRLDKTKEERDRLRGTLETLEASLKQTVEQCKEKFGCEPDALPDEITRLEKEMNEALAKARSLLGIEE